MAFTAHDFLRTVTSSLSPSGLDVSRWVLLRGSKKDVKNWLFDACNRKRNPSNHLNSFFSYENQICFVTVFRVKKSNFLFLDQLRSGETGELKATIRSSMETSFPVMCCRFNPSRREIFYASSACGNIFACTTNNYEFTRFIVGQ